MRVFDICLFGSREPRASDITNKRTQSTEIRQTVEPINTPAPDAVVEFTPRDLDHYHRYLISVLISEANRLFRMRKWQLDAVDC